MNKEQKQEAIEILKGYFSQYQNFYVTNTESLNVAQINKLRKICFEKNITFKVAKNTLINKALQALNTDYYNQVIPALNGVTALMFSESPKEPALVISSFREETKGDKPTLKMALIDGSAYIGDKELATLKALKSKQELIGDILTLLQSPTQNVLYALQSAPQKLAGLVEALEKRG